jgi:copper(I)-binding protein
MMGIISKQVAMTPLRLHAGGASGTIRSFRKDRGMKIAFRRGRFGACIAPFAWAFAVSVAAAQPVDVRNAWVRAPAPGQKVAGAYMELTGRESLALVSVASPAAGRVELHGTTSEASVMRMRRVDKVELPAGKPVRLEPGGLHVMLMDLKRSLKPGDRVPLTLTFQRADSSRAPVTVDAEVRPAAPVPAHHAH